MQSSENSYSSSSAMGFSCLVGLSGKTMGSLLKFSRSALWLSTNQLVEPIPIQTSSWPDRYKIKHLFLLLVSHDGAACG